MATQYFAGTDLTLSLTVTDQNGSAINLTGATVTVKMLDPQQFQRILTPTITSATAGEISVSLSSSQLALAGEYQFQAIIVNSGLTSASSIFSLTLTPQLF